MLNILMPIGAKSTFFDSPEYPFAKPLIEIGGKSMVQLAVENLNTIDREKKFIFVVRTEDCSKYHLDNVLKLVTDENCEIVRLRGDTAGAACSALMAIEHIDNDEPLVISNSDQIIEEDLNHILNHFEFRNLDAAVICFETIHPRWSYVKLDSIGKIVESAEKKPLSKLAIAGFYYFRKGHYFVSAAMENIKKNASVDGVFYIAPTLNEMVLKNMNLETYIISNENYHTFYMPQKIKDYEQSIRL